MNKENKLGMGLGALLSTTNNNSEISNGIQKINISQILLTLEDTEKRRRAINAKRTIENLFNLNFVPIVNENDTIATSESK